MPWDERKRWAGTVKEASTREARRTHPGAESTDPPPPPADPSWPPKPIEGQGSPSPTISRSDPLPKVERRARWAKALTSIGAALVALATGMWGAGKWTLMQAKTALDERVDDRCAKIAASAIASAVAPPEQPSHAQRIKDLEKKERKNGQRWDKLDDFVQEKFQKPNQPKVKKFGPAAEARGGATYPETDE